MNIEKPTGLIITQHTLDMFTSWLEAVKQNGHTKSTKFAVQTKCAVLSRNRCRINMDCLNCDKALETIGYLNQLAEVAKVCKAYDKGFDLHRYDDIGRIGTTKTIIPSENSSLNIEIYNGGFNRQYQTVSIDTL